MARTAVVLSIAVIVIVGACGSDSDSPNGSASVADADSADAPTAMPTSSAESSDRSASRSETVPVGRSLAADTAEKAFADPDYRGSLEALAAALGPPDVESVDGVTYDRSRNTILVELQTGLPDTSGRREVAWLTTSIFAAHIAETNFLSDLGPAMELSLSGDLWWCPGEVVSGIARKDVLERHFEARCGEA